ncbi:unnamed protein product [Phyllotreta striolata]|uniref:Uncharacterized protein n=1 Tax=Phyllotreta striolata TaxID=444603 RepID=A0A9N9THB8_PHYSR|nr:unnamed protein product [Phyllotreta striolata]
MFAVNASRIASRVQVLQQARNMSALSGPPQVKISTAERLVHAAILVTGVLATPMWILAHIREYRGVS